MTSWCRVLITCYVIWSSDLLLVSKSLSPQDVTLEYRVLYCDESGYWDDQTEQHVKVPSVHIQSRMSVQDRHTGWTEQSRTNILLDELKQKESVDSI